MSKSSLAKNAVSLADDDSMAVADDVSVDSDPVLFGSTGVKASSGHVWFGQVPSHSVAALAVKCKHNSMPVCPLHSALHHRRGTGGLWLPYVAVLDHFKHSQLPALVGELLLRELRLPCDRRKLVDQPELVPFHQVSLHSQTTVGLPNGRQVARLVFVGHWRESDPNCCTNTANLKWIPVTAVIDAAKPPPKHIQSLVNQVWGSEVSYYAGLLNHTSVVAAETPVNCATYQHIEHGFEQAMKYVARPVQEHTTEPTTDSTKMYASFVASGGFGKAQVTKLYADFVQHCYPSVDMSYASFEDFAKRTGLTGVLGSNKLDRLFHAMNYKLKDFVGFNELLFGLVALDPEAEHKTPRYTFLFRYFDLNSDGLLDQTDLKALAEELPKQTHLKSGVSSMDFAQFVKAIESDQLKGTAKLCRATRSMAKLVAETTAYEPLEPVKWGKSLDELNVALGSSSTCERCHPRRFAVTTHSVRLGSTGRVCDPRPLSTAVQQSQASASRATALHSQHQLEYTFNAACVAHFVLGQVGKLTNYGRMSEAHKQDVRQEVSSALSPVVIYGLLDQVVELLAAECRVLSLSSPIMVLGDTHGNIHDLLTFEGQLWPRAPAVVATNYLFLGDYVDRGEFGLEVVCYLFAMKVLAPTKFFLLRGNHEVRSLQRAFTFERECKAKFGERIGLEVWERINTTFDQLPFAAVIDGSIFCAHGGIPFTTPTIAELQKLPTIICDPEMEAPPVWEILWSDPITNLDFKKLALFMKKQDDTGFLPNMKRATANYYSEKATENFLRLNGLSYVIRAHEVVNEGYRFNHRGRVITVFSCSHYCGGMNKAAAILIEAHRSGGGGGGGGEQTRVGTTVHEVVDGYIKILSLDT